MKRSSTGDNSPIIKKKVRDNTTEEEPITTDIFSPIPSANMTHTTHTASDSNTSPAGSMSVIRYVYGLVHNLEQGNIDHCLSHSIDSSQFDETLSAADTDLLNALDSNLKKIAQRQLQLETENLRSRIMIQQQHQLLTASNHEEKDHSESSKGPSQEDKERTTNTTPEDSLTSVHDSSLLEKLENSYREMPKIPQQKEKGSKKKKIVYLASSHFLFRISKNLQQ